MAIDRRDETDGITTRRVLRVTGEPTPEEQAAIDRHQARLGFEASMPAIEKLALKARTRHFDTITRYGSHAWYAQRVLSLALRVRQYRDAGRVDEALWAAVLIGHAIAESNAKEWPDLTFGREYRKNQRDSAVRGVQAKRQDRAPRDHALMTAVRQYRGKHQGARTRAIATALLREHGRTCTDRADRERAIDALRKRIERLPRK